MIYNGNPCPICGQGKSAHDGLLPINFRPAEKTVGCEEHGHLPPCTECERNEAWLEQGRLLALLCGYRDERDRYHAELAPLDEVLNTTTDALEAVTGKLDAIRAIVDSPGILLDHERMKAIAVILGVDE